MATLTLRNVKGTPLTYTEVDNNFSNLNNELGGFKNKIINGNFGIQQTGGTSFTATGYSVDRWFSDFGSGGAGIVSLQAFALGQTAVPGEPEFFLRHQQTTGGSTPSQSQRVEDVRTFAGETCILSVWLKVASGTLSVTPSLRQVFGTGGSPSSPVDHIGSAWTVTTSWQKFTFTTTLTSISGKTIGTNNDDRLVVLISGPNLTTFTLDISQVQLEAGSTASAFEKRHIDQELRLCQRYFQVLGQIQGDGVATSTTSIVWKHELISNMRGNPSIVLAPTVTTTTARDLSTITTFNSTSSVTLVFANSKTLLFNQGGYSGLTQGRVFTQQANSFWLHIDAEL